MLFTKVKSISTKELQEQLNNQPTIVDVREDFEYQGGHIPSAVNLPLSTLDQQTGNQKLHEPWYLICRSGARSMRAAKYLTKAGYDVINVKGGMNAWNGPVQN
ncbi:rhodanese-like domain-containing protein [Lentilactobacillus sunkii]|uniref:Rhodanese-like protein n=1 Tax=Lentilactobacillus sunkii DSM 19904 TaxID=1423808 RepID=A0A0R1L2L4_9LACO|nr:rhodanese-like domain-containing protein [Lentilactobacillus sunkii]KRK89941.1 rhodanese-like protein [Lentilactobacillus sunkii DSM 19904]